MNIDEIINAVRAGKLVRWKSDIYKVIQDRNKKYLIYCALNDACIGLTNEARTELNGNNEDFFIVKPMVKMTNGSKRFNAEAFYLTYVNDYLTANRIAEDYGINSRYAADLIECGKIMHNNYKAVV